jgi:hypothetical protein
VAVRPEPTSGLAVHVLDFSHLRAVGEGFRIEPGGTVSHPFAIAPDLYRGLVRAHVGDDQRRLHPLERGARLDGRLSLPGSTDRAAPPRMIGGSRLSRGAGYPLNVTVCSSVKACMTWVPPTRPMPLSVPERPPKGRWLSQ